MKLTTHQISPKIFSALAEGRGGSEAIKYLTAIRNSKNLLMIRALVDLTSKIGHDDAPVVKDAYRTLSKIEELTPGSVGALLNYPTVSAWLIRTVMLIHEGKLSDAWPAQLAAVAASAAVHGTFATTIVLPTTSVDNHTVQLPSLGVATFPAGVRGVVRLSINRDQVLLFDDNATIEIPKDLHKNAPNWKAIPRILSEHDGIRIFLSMDGLSAEYLPKMANVCNDAFDRRVIDTWRRTIAAGWRVLVTNHREVATEVAATHTMLVPLRGSANSQVSATLNDAFGCVAMSLPQDPRSTALTLAHEVQHAKLSVLGDLFPLVHQGADGLFYAPWRDDPRPLAALLQGAYAHFGVAAFWKRQCHRENNSDHARLAEVEFARWCEASRGVGHFLIDSRKLTPVGQHFVIGMVRILDEWNTNHVSKHARVAAQRLAKKHREHWQRIHGQAG